MLQDAKVIAFTVSELLRENQERTRVNSNAIKMLFSFTIIDFWRTLEITFLNGEIILYLA